VRLKRVTCQHRRVNGKHDKFIARANDLQMRWLVKTCLDKTLLAEASSAGAASATGSTWHLDEMFVTLRGEPFLLWRAVDENAVDLDILLQRRRDKAAANRFFLRVLRSNQVFDYLA
jgi:transposase-like protein